MVVYKSFKRDRCALIIGNCTYRRCRGRLYSPHKFDAMSGFQCSFDINKCYSRGNIVCYLARVTPVFLLRLTFALRSPFLEFVTTTANFDSLLASYVKTSYVQQRYVHRSARRKRSKLNFQYRFETLLGCTNVDLTNTTELYAQYTTSVICNGIIQNSKSICGLSDADSEPLCADSCVSY